MEKIIYGIQLPKVCKESWCQEFSESMEIPYIKNGENHYFAEVIVSAEKDQTFTLTDVMSILTRKKNELLDWNSRFLGSVHLNIQKFDKWYNEQPSLFIIRD